MDPNETMRVLAAAESKATASRPHTMGWYEAHEDAWDAAEALLGWLGRGGFRPSGCPGAGQLRASAVRAQDAIEGGA